MVFLFGVVFALIGWFLVQASRQSDSSEAGGLGEALRTLEQGSYGPWVLGVVALGLIAYGLFQFINARYRRIQWGSPVEVAWEVTRFEVKKPR